MSSKLATLAVLLVALMAIAEATTYTTITTTTIDEEAADHPINPHGARGERSQCKQVITREDVSHCRKYIMGGGEEYSSSLRMVVVNPQGMEQEHLRQCCQQLRSINRDCRCEAMKTVMPQQGTGHMEEMMRKVMELPQRCECEVSWQCMQPSF